jgi:hypothetical protein
MWFHSVDPTILQCLLHYEIVKSGRTMTDGCKIIVGLVKMYDGNVKILNCKLKFLKNTYMYKNHSRGVGYVI